MVKFFKTASGSLYAIDLERKLITGGVFGINDYEYTSAQILVGARAVICLTNGQTIITNIITEYI